MKQYKQISSITSSITEPYINSVTTYNQYNRGTTKGKHT